MAPAVWLADYLSEVNQHFAVKQLARSEFYSAAFSESIDVVWEYHAWRQAAVSLCLPCRATLRSASASHQSKVLSSFP